MEFPNLLRASNSTQIDALIEGLPVNANGYFLTEEQATSIEAALDATADPAALASVQQQLAEANTARETAEASLVTANATIATHVETISTQASRITELESESTLTQTTREKDEVVGGAKIPSYLDDKNPANAAADRFFGKPVSKK